MKAIRVLFMLVAVFVIGMATGCTTTYGVGGGFNGTVIYNMMPSEVADLVLVSVNGAQCPRLTTIPGMQVQDPICFADVGSTRMYGLTACKRDPTTGQMKFVGFKLVQVRFDSYHSLVGSGYGGGNSVKTIVLTTDGWSQNDPTRVHGPDYYAN